MRRGFLSAALALGLSLSHAAWPIPPRGDQCSVLGPFLPAPRSFDFEATAQDVTPEALKHTYIVSFKAYRPLEEHARFLHTLLDDVSPHWTHLPRNNPGARIPTDFALLRVDGNVSTGGKKDEARVLRALRGSRGVKYVTLEQQVKRVPLAVPEDNDNEHDGGAGDRDTVATRPSGRSLLAEEMAALDPDDVSGFVPPQRFRGKRVLSGMQGEHEQLGSNSRTLSSSGDKSRAFSGSFEDDPSNIEVEVEGAGPAGRRLLREKEITTVYSASKIWDKGYTGQHVKVAVFDTGLRKTHTHFNNVEDITNWTSDNTKEDHIGHGSFVAGVIASKMDCLGFAPDAELHIFRVFTTSQLSYTSWFLDAFNYAIHSHVDVLNLSIGGPDFLDRPFVEKVDEMIANGIIMVSAIGNDGPLYGTLNSPADQLSVIGVGGIDYSDRVARFSSRGMTTWELPEGYGRVKPDLMAYGNKIRGSHKDRGCRTLSGTSVASPVVAGAVTLLASTLSAAERAAKLNPASMKQWLVESARPVKNHNIFEQGMGKMDVLGAYEVLKAYEPRASLVPGKLDMTDCPYMWPYCSQDMYFGAVPIVANMTVLNGMSVSGRFWTEPEFVPESDHDQDVLDVVFTHADVIWPWASWLAAHISVRAPVTSARTVTGHIVFKVSSDRGELSAVQARLTVKVIPTPPREKRLLFDQFHNLRYPSGYFPRDNLDTTQDILDWNGDHLHTNYKGLWDGLRAAGYFIEILGRDMTCFDAYDYGALLLVDPEEEYFPEEVHKLRDDVLHKGLGLVVMADWYNVAMMKKIKFFDENTKSWWIPHTGGANVPALNSLLGVFGVAFGDRIYKSSNAVLGDSRHRFSSGTALAMFPEGGYLVSAQVMDVTSGGKSGASKTVPILGAVDTADLPDMLVSPVTPIAQSPVRAEEKEKHLRAGGEARLQHVRGMEGVEEEAKPGRVVVYGDSNCVDSNHLQGNNCIKLVLQMINFAISGKRDQNLFPDTLKLNQPYRSDDEHPPVRMENHGLEKHSRVLKAGAAPQCLRMAGMHPEQGGSLGEGSHKDGEEEEGGSLGSSTEQSTGFGDAATIGDGGGGQDIPTQHTNKHAPLHSKPNQRSSIREGWNDHPEIEFDPDYVARQSSKLPHPKGGFRSDRVADGVPGWWVVVLVGAMLGVAYSSRDYLAQMLSGTRPASRRRDSKPSLPPGPRSPKEAGLLA